MKVSAVGLTIRASRPARKHAHRAFRPAVDGLEERRLLTAVSVDAAQVVRTVDTQVLGVNLVWWDSELNTPQTEQMVQAAGLTMFRFPGGSSADDFHFNAPPSYDGQGTDASIASFIAAVGGVGIATVDYGSGSPQEAAAFLAYLDAPVGNTTPIGDGQEWSDTAGAWQTVDWQTAGYWASLRAAAPLAVDDGLNFLRLDHPAPFGTHYWEIGNEEYGSWEVDHHTAQHDPATYIAFATQFQAYANQIAPGISIGLDVGSPGDFDNWTANILQQSASQGLTVGFLSDHNYVQGPGDESDSNLLLDTVSDTDSDPDDPGNPYDWAVRAADYENLLTQYLGAAGANVELLATEFNSVYTNPGKQSTSLVNGLFVADSLGALLDTRYDGADVWDLRNGYSTDGNNSSSLYGWRQGGDYGIIGSPGGSAPATGAYVPYPTYFAEQLVSKIAQSGGDVVQATSSDPNLTVYSVLEPDGHLDLLVINKSATGALTGQFALSGFQPSTQANVWQYGEAQDTAQSQSTDGQSALASSTASLSVNGTSFDFSFPAYSMTVLDLPAAPVLPSGPVITQPAAANPSPVWATTADLSVAASDPTGSSTLTFTWATTGNAPAPVSFSVNGTNAAQDSVATFSRAGSYTFQVTVTDPGGNTATSSLTVVVNQSLASIVVSPGSVSVTAGAEQKFTATGYDQFGALMAVQPAFAWSVANGPGAIDAASGVYTAPGAAGAATVRAASGAIAGTAQITVTAAPVQAPPVGAPPVSPPPVAPTHPSASVAFAVVQSSRKQFEAMITLTNTGATPFANWVLKFQFAARITGIWNAVIAGRSRARYAIVGDGGDSTLAADQSISFTIVGKPGHFAHPPAGYRLNGVKVQVQKPARTPRAERP